VKHGHGPPGSARWLLERALPADVREDVSGDLEEMFRRRTVSEGLTRSRVWYWRQTLSFSAHFLMERLRDRPAETSRTSGAHAAALPREDWMSTGMSWMDFKLGWRMLVKYPGLTLVGGLGMAVAIAIGAGSFALIYASLHPTLPLDEGERIVGLENWDADINNQDYRSLHDFVSWRDELKSVETIGAFRAIQRNLVAPDGRSEAIAVAEMTASGFQVARVPPLLGRPLVSADERTGAPAVLVIGYELWRTRFASESSIIGRSVRLGATVHTVVGVMPPGFEFPVNHRAWVPLRLNPSDYERRQGPRISVFGRLAPGVTLERAQVELTTIGQRTAAAFPKTHERLRPRVVLYTETMFDDEPRRGLHFMQVLISLLVVVVGVNVAILVYARTATRQTEIAVRTALGASRRRIVGQFFVEALVLSLVAASAGLFLANVALRQADAAAKQLAAPMGSVPFWMTFELSSGTVVYVE
jgi:putative ABC transport system permease protein